MVTVPVQGRTQSAVDSLAEIVGLKVWPEFTRRCSTMAKEVFLLGGWRGGKSNSAAFITLLAVVRELIHSPGQHLVWVVGPEYPQAREEFNYLLRWSTKLMMVLGEASVPQQGPMRMVLGQAGFPGQVVVETKSASDPTSLGSVAPNIILAAEAGQFSEEARDWLSGRALEKNAQLIWSGTFENDEGKPQYQWFEEAARLALRAPTPRQAVFQLPSWDNMALFRSCLEGENSITYDPTLTAFCPDEEHGEAHQGLNHPMIRLKQLEFSGQPNLWRKKFGGEPIGVLNPIYEWAQDRERFLIPMPPELKGIGPGQYNRQWLLTAGGIDYGSGGTNHPSAITIASMTNDKQRDIWVRFSQKDRSGNMDQLYGMRDSLDRQFRVSPGCWGGDRVATAFNPSFLGVKTVSSAVSTRMGGVGVVNGYAQAGRLFFDSTDPGVCELYEEIMSVHMRRRADGQLVYDTREGDDMTASFEDAVIMLYQPRVIQPETIRTPGRQFSRTTRRATIGQRRGV